ncbi:MAG: DNA polymerase IV [Xanthomonadales bacterium]|jgi:DNA polymerase-4|nr:DNA polymerase IV [Xanthomonadales bacterium]
MRAIIHVDMDAFYASVEQRDRPELASQAVIVGGTGRRGVVAAASYEARSLGVRSAMPTAQARRLAPRAHYVRPRMERYREVSRQVFDVFRNYTPLVEGLSLDEAFLDVTGSLALFGSRETIGQRIVADIREVTGLQASVGLAHNKFLAKLASDADKPAGFVSVPPDGVRRFLDPMPIGRLWGIGKKTEPKLRALGILTIGQLRRADPGALREALGNRGGHFQALARGEDDREVQPVRPDKSISHEQTFSENLEDAREMRAELLRQAENVMRRVRAQHLAASTVTVKIRDHRFHTVTRSLTLRASTRSTRTVYQAASGLLTRWLETNKHTPVRLLGVGVSKLEEGVEPRLGDLDEALDDITDRFGAGMVTRGLALRKPPA